MDPAGYYYLIKPQRVPNDIISPLNEALLLKGNEYHFQSPTIMPNAEYRDFTFDGSINDALRREDDKNVLMIVPTSTPSIPCAALVYSYKPNTEDEMGTIYINFLASNKRQTSMCGGTGQSLIKIFIDAVEVITPMGKTIQIKLYDAAKNKKFYDFIMSPKDATGYRYYNTGYKRKYTDQSIPLTRQASGPHSIIYDVHGFEKGNTSSLTRDVLAFPHNVGRYPTELAIESQKQSPTPPPSPPQSQNPRWRQRTIAKHIVSRAPFKDNARLRLQEDLNEKLIEDHAVHNYLSSVEFLKNNFKNVRDQTFIIEHFECIDDNEIELFKATYRMANAKGITKRKTKKRKRRNPRKRITYNLKRRH
jgi:hypothetical protein